MALVQNIKDALVYTGGYILRSMDMALSSGTMCLSENGQRLYCTKGATLFHLQYEDPTLTLNAEELTKVSTAVEPMIDFNTYGKNFGLPFNNLEITGMVEVGGELILTYLSTYDGAANETNNIMVFRDSSDLNNSVLDGPFQLIGGARGVGTVSTVPAEHQTLFGGSLLSTTAWASIASRLSQGPSAYSFSPSDLVGAGVVDEEELTTRPAAIGDELLYYTTDNDKILYNKDKYPTSLVSEASRSDTLLLAKPVNGADGFRIEHDLWTIISRVAVSFIIPGTDTLVCIGGLNGPTGKPGFIPNDNVPTVLPGVDYNEGGKWYWNGTSYVQETVSTKGYNRSVDDDSFAYYWLYDLNDLQRSKEGLLDPWDIRPYKWGYMTLPTIAGDADPYSRSIAGRGHFSLTDQKLHLSMANRYPNPSSSALTYPIVLTFDLDSDILLNGTTQDNASEVIKLTGDTYVSVGQETTVTAEIENKSYVSSYTYDWQVEQGSVVLSFDEPDVAKFTVPSTEEEIIISCVVSKENVVFTKKTITVSSVASITFPDHYVPIISATINPVHIPSNLLGKEVILTEACLGDDLESFFSNYTHGSGPLRISADLDGLVQLPIDILRFDYNSREMAIRTKVDLDSTTGATVYFWKGPSADVQPDPSSTYGSLAVYDMDTVFSINTYNIDETPALIENSADDTFYSYGGSVYNRGSVLGRVFDGGADATINLGSGPIGLPQGFAFTASIYFQSPGTIFAANDQGLSNGRIWHWGINPSNQIQYILYKEGNFIVMNVSGNTTLSTNTVYVVSFTYDGTTARGYVNGVLDMETPLSDTITDVNNETTMSMGGRITTGNSIQTRITAQMGPLLAHAGSVKPVDEVLVDHANLLSIQDFWSVSSVDNDPVVEDAPIANTGADQSNINAGELVTLSGVGSYDNDGTISEYRWREVTSSGVVISDENGETITFTAPSTNADQTITFGLIVVDDNSNLSDEVFVNIQVNKVNNNPVFVGTTGPTNSKADTDITVEGNFTDEGNLTYSVVVTPSDVTYTNNGNVVSLNTGKSVNQRDIVITFTATDDGGLTVTGTHMVNVEPYVAPINNTTPTAAITGNTTGTVGTEQTFLASTSTDPENDTLSYSWSLIVPSGSSATLTNATGVTTAYTPDIDGSYDVLLTVSDGELSDNDILTIAISEAPDTAPTANAGANQTLAANIQGQLSGSGTATTAGATITGYQWIAPAGITLSGANTANPTFTAPQLNAATTFTFSLVVTDSNGLTSVADTVDVVVEAYSPPVETDTTIPVITLTGGDISLSVGEAFEEPGYSAYDNKDGYLTASVVITGSTDTSYPRTGTLSYNVRDEAGNQAVTKTRNFSVVSESELLAEIAKTKFTLSKEKVFYAFSGRGNLDELKFKLNSTNQKIALDNEGCFDFSENDITKVSVISDSGEIDSSTSAVTWSGSSLFIQFGAFSSPAQRSSIRIVVYVGNDDKGIVIAGAGLPANIIVTFQ